MDLSNISTREQGIICWALNHCPRELCPTAMRNIVVVSDDILRCVAEADIQAFADSIGYTVVALKHLDVDKARATMEQVLLNWSMPEIRPRVFPREDVQVVMNKLA